MPAGAARIVTETEFLKLPESVHQTELIDGEVFVAPAPTFGHQRAAFRLMTRLGVWVEPLSDRFTVVPSPIDIRFAPGRILQPDIAVFDQRIDPAHRGPIDLTPVLVVEVLSDRLYDRVTKRMIYAKAGVTEYWCVDPNGSVEVWTGEDLGRSEFVEGDLTSPLLPGFSLSVAALFAE